MCRVCGRQDCGVHDSVLAFAQLVDRCALIVVALLTGAIALVVALVAS